MLEALLSAPVALSACKRGPPRAIPGSIRGASMDLGHKLRMVGQLEAPRDRQRTKIAIVGAGPSGLSAAWRLEQLGVRDYVIFDLEDRAGGTSTFGDDGVVPYPWGAHYVPMPSVSNRALVTLLKEIGAVTGRIDNGELIGAEEQLVRAPEERIFYLGKWYEGLYLHAGASSTDVSELARFQREIDRFIGWRDASGRRAFTLPIAHVSDDAELTALDRMSMLDWMRTKNLSSKRLMWLVDYACRDDYGLRAGDTSAWAGLFYFASRAAEKGEAAAPLLSWPNGNGRLVEHLAHGAGDRVRQGALVLEVNPGETQVDLTVLNRGKLESWSADHVIFAVPKFTASHVIKPWRDAPPAHLASLDYGAWMVANLHLSGRPTSRGFPMAWDNVLYDSPSLGYVVATHQKLLDHGRTIWTYYFPLTDPDPREGRKRLLALDHAGWCDVIVSDLSRAHPDLTEHIERIDVWRWGHAMARPKPGAMWSGARAKAAEPLGRVHFAHSDLSGMGLFEEAQYWGVHAAEEAVRATGRVVESIT